MTERRLKRRQDETPTEFETPWGFVMALILLALGMAGYLSLVSYSPGDLPSSISFSAQSPGNDPLHNIIGKVGAYGSGFGYFIFGAPAFLIPTALIWFGVNMLVSRQRFQAGHFYGLLVWLLAACVLMDVQPWFLTEWARQKNMLSSGGGIGWVLGSELLAKLFGRVGAVLLAFVAYVIGFIMLTGFHPVRFFVQVKEALVLWYEQWQEDRIERAAAMPFRKPLTPMGEIQALEAEYAAAELAKPKKGRGSRVSKKVSADGLDDELVIAAADVSQALSGGIEAGEDAVEPVQMELPLPAKPEPKIVDSSVRRAERDPDKPSLADLRRKAREGKDSNGAPLVNTTWAGNFAHYELPEVELLDLEDTSGRKPADPAALLAIQNTIIRTLGTFAIKVSPGDITRGPTITRYEIYPEEGLRVNRITALEADLARATKAERINILAPIPGKDTVGIEIANSEKVAVPLRELLEDPVFTGTKAKLPVALGKDVYGNTIVGDLAAMPHLLVAGATGSGKSVCINSIIASLLFQFSPDQLRFIMVDPKVVEMAHYNELPHLVIPVVTDPKKTLMALSWVVNEMERRYQTFAKCGVKNFDGFNGRPKKRSAAELAAAAKLAAGPEKAPAAKIVTKPDALPADLIGEIPAGPAAACAAVEEEEVVWYDDEEEAASAAEDTIPDFLPDGDGDSIKNYDLAPSEEELQESALIAHEVRMPKPDEEIELHLDAPVVQQRFDGTTDESVWDIEEDDIDADLHREPEVPDRYPYIVVIIDELADLMQTAPADIEVAICRIAQKARAAGIHLILATQTPRADVITGVIKANIPCKIAFQVSNGLDSRVILDTKGAEKLVGKGDMLYLPPGSAKLQRAQGAFVTDEEVHRLVEFCKKQAKPSYAQDARATVEGTGGGGDGEEVTEEDEEIYDKCLEVIMQEKRASTSLLQRRLRLGYTRAARMMDIMEERGIIGPGEGAKPREILVDLSDSEE